ncbi:hypothetical protein VP1G_06827 [Cytospora mali]|uniref:R3H domain-containing protein 1 n=1 Tax=Cytospora mali TaxID=578113 RepID=A0A194V6W9_CYTMA|nr:hypothetical protein VP1G_06827 [Valsa mali var. pyri (nom. inval.)]
MATVRTTMTDVKKQKLSFAKVLASAPTDNNPMSTTTRDAKSNSGRENQTPPSSNPSGRSTAASPVIANGASETTEKTTTAEATEPSGEDQVADGLRKLNIDSNAAPSLVVNGASSTSTQQSSKAQTPSDEASQKADSSSELGTKPPSLDGKSITSGTTFNALDEKESLRPDDSASVMAAEQDDDIFSIRGSLIAGSRMGSEVAARVQRIQLGDMPPRSVATQHVIVESGSQGVVPPQNASLEQQPVTDAKIALVGATSAPNGMYGQHPDEKLLEAMQSQKDRLFLLKLEEMVIEFVQDSKEPFMDLPPSNSFCRMLTHKLADYYHMTHSFEAGAGGVRIFRTPFCRVPPSLASIAQSASAASTPPPMVMPKKIMRRGEIGDFGPGGFGLSMPNSESGSDAKDKANGKEKMSREEREEAYNKARERIFGTATTETSTPDNDESAGISRASSVSTRDKSNGGKKARRRRDSDNFDTRSNYVAYAPAYGHPQQATWVQPHYMPANTQFSGPVQQPYPTQMPNMYPPSQQYPSMLPGSSYGPQYNSMSNYSQPPGPPRYQPPVNSMPPAPYVQPMQGPPPSQHGWQQPPPPPPSFNQSPYQSRATPAGTPGIPYAYGALPANANPNDPKSQHPIPGSFNRHAFNPKTQSFVPGNGMPPMPPPPGPYNGYGPQQGSPQIAPPHLAYAGYQAAPPPMAQPPYGNTSGYNMMRQGSNNSLPPYHPPPTAQHPHVSHQLPPHPPPQGPPHIPNKPTMPQGPAMSHGPPYSNLPNYGNPAALPQKPTT